MQKQNSNILVSQLRELILEARQAAYRNVNTLQIITNYLIGKTIVDRLQHGNARAAYAKEQLTTASRKLTKEFGRGYSVDNLELMRRFFIAYQNHLGISAIPISETLSRKSSNISSKALLIKLPSQNSETLSRISANEKHLLKLTWSHFVLLMKMNDAERRFYEIESAQNNWSVRELEKNFF